MTTPESGATLGQLVTQFRTRREMSQKELAAEVGRSESWVSQVERDVLKVERLPVLQGLANALGVAVRDLRPDAEVPYLPAGPSDMDSLRAVLTGHPAPDLLLSRPAAQTVDVEAFRERVERAWELAHASAFADLNTELVSLLPSLEHAMRTARRGQRNDLAGLLATAYQAAAAAFARLDEADAAWIAADRSISVAEQGDDHLAAVAGLFRMAHAFITLRRLDQAQDVCQNGVIALAPALSEKSPQPGVLSLAGALTLTLAVVHARAGRRADARAAVADARHLAEKLGEDRDDYQTEFGPANVDLHAIAVAVDLGDAGEALEIAETVDASGLSAERQSRLNIDIARAHGQRRQVGEAVHALLEAERHAPEQVYSHVLVRDLVRELLSLSGRRAPDDLVALAKRCAALS